MDVDPKAETPSQRSSVHYYDRDDNLGDLLVTVGTTEFRVHKLFLSFASEMFRSMFACKASQNGSKLVDSIVLTDMTADEFNDMLTFIYPHTTLDVSWSKLPYLLSIADKYIMTNLTECCLRFLEQSFLDKTLTTTQ